MPFDTGLCVILQRQLQSPVGLYPVCVLIIINNLKQRRTTSKNNIIHPDPSCPHLSPPPSVLCNGCTYTYLHQSFIIIDYSITCFQLRSSDSIVSIIFPFPAHQRREERRRRRIQANLYLIHTSNSRHSLNQWWIDCPWLQAAGKLN